MPRGGARAGAGRPKKADSAKATRTRPYDVKLDAAAAGMTPLDYMLSVMMDPGADPARRDRMAQAAAPFVHAKPGEARVGKKESAQEAAESAGEGTDWGADLQAPAALN